MYDLVILNGMVIDGSGVSRRQADVAVKNGRIVGIGPEVAFVDVGGKGEATIEIAELLPPSWATRLVVNG